MNLKSLLQIQISGAIDTLFLIDNTDSITLILANYCNLFRWPSIPVAIENFLI